MITPADEEIATEYTNGGTIDAILEKYKISRPRLYRILARYNVKVRTKVRRDTLEEDELEEAIHLYTERKATITGLSSRFNVQWPALARMLEDRGVPIRQGRRGADIRTLELRVCQLYQDGIPTMAICTQFQIRSDRLYRILKRNGIKLRVERYTQEQREKARTMCEAGATYEEIAKTTGIGSSHLTRILHREQVRPETIQKNRDSMFILPGQLKVRSKKECAREYYLLSTYGMSARQYDSIFKAQGGRCALCGNPEEELTDSGRVRNLSIDHNHQTGAFRSLLCQRCNHGLGHFRDDIALLEKAITYLKSFQSDYPRTSPVS